MSAQEALQLENLHGHPVSGWKTMGRRPMSERDDLAGLLSPRFVD